MEKGDYRRERERGAGGQGSARYISGRSMNALNEGEKERRRGREEQVFCMN